MTARFACALLFCRNFSTQTGVRAATTAVSARSAASLLAVLLVIQPPQDNPGLQFGPNSLHTLLPRDRSVAYFNSSGSKNASWSRTRRS